MAINEFILLIIGAYLLGSVPSAYLIGKWSRKIDIRQYGSGNVGASNIMTLVSKRWSIPVIIFDFTKGMVMVWITQLVGLGISQQITVGLAVIIGHNWPIFLRFNGGRGALTTLGIILIFSPKLGLLAVALAFLFLPFHQLSLGALIASTLIPILSWFLSQPLDIDIEKRLPITVGYLVMLFLSIFRRLTAPLSPLSASVSTKELIVNRLFLDRDIRDRKTWLNRAPVEEKPIEPPLETKDGSSAD